RYDGFMEALVANRPGGPEVLEILERPDPVPGPSELLVRVRAAGVNRPDVLQRKGQYPPPPGASDVLGLEMAGEVVSAGQKVPCRDGPGVTAARANGTRRIAGDEDAGFAPGDRVFGLLAGGACAELAVLDYRMALPVPPSLSFAEAAAIPET